MVVIFTIPLQTFPWQQFFPVPLNIMVYCTGNVGYGVIISAQLLYFPVRRQKKIQQTFFQQYVFMFTVTSNVVIYTADIHTTNKQSVQCVPQYQDLT